MNLYAYAGGDPVNMIDPSGLDDWTNDPNELAPEAVPQCVPGDPVDENCQINVNSSMSCSGFFVICNTFYISRRPDFVQFTNNAPPSNGGGGGGGGRTPPPSSGCNVPLVALGNKMRSWAHGLAIYSLGATVTGAAVTTAGLPEIPVTDGFSVAPGAAISGSGMLAGWGSLGLELAGTFNQGLGGGGWRNFANAATEGTALTVFTGSVGWLAAGSKSMGPLNGLTGVGAATYGLLPSGQTNNTCGAE